MLTGKSQVYPPVTNHRATGNLAATRVVLVTRPESCNRGRGTTPLPMPLSKLSGDEQRIIFSQLCNVLDPGSAVALSSVSNELRTATQAPLPQLKADHEAAAALCLKLGHQSCKELREAIQHAIPLLFHCLRAHPSRACLSVCTRPPPSAP